MKFNLMDLIHLEGENMIFKKYIYILFIIIGLIGVSAAAIYKNQKVNNLFDENVELEDITINPPPGGLNEPVKVELSEEEIEKVPIYKE